MRNPLATTVVLLVWLALGSACATSRQVDDFVPEADDWPQIMEDVIGPIYSDQLVQQASRTDGEPDFALVEREATRAARHMALGHGLYAQPDAPRFGEYARQAEQWFLDVARAARERRTESMRTLILDGEIEHCDRCHAAFG